MGFNIKGFPILGIKIVVAYGSLQRELVRGLARYIVHLEDTMAMGLISLLNSDNVTCDMLWGVHLLSKCQLPSSYCM